MTPFKHHLCNTSLGAPQNWDESSKGECLALPVHRGEGIYYSWWKLTWHERISALLGKPIRLCIHGNGHPPVWLDVDGVQS